MADETRNVPDVERDRNPDPITGEPGAHPVGAGLGAAVGGAAAGAAAGAVAGPIGTAVGVIAGGVAGGLAGKGIAESIDPTTEENYWREEYAQRDYYDPTIGYPEVGPAYRHGWESRAKYPDRTFTQAEPDIEREWPTRRGNSSLNWQQVRRAAQDAWERIDTQCGCERVDEPMRRTPK